MKSFFKIAVMLVAFSSCSKNSSDAEKPTRSQNDNDFIERLTYHQTSVAEIDELVKSRQINKGILSERVGVEGDVYWTPLCFAVVTDNREAVKQLLASGADLQYKDQNGMTPLLLAANAGAIESIDLLLKNGADIEAKDLDGNTALIQAAAAGNVNTVKYLVSKGCHLAQPNNALNALDFAIFYQHKEVTAFLVNQGLKRTNVPDTASESYLRGESR